jgi:hypothetical protein
MGTVNGPWECVGYPTSIFGIGLFLSAASIVQFYGSVMYVSTLPWPCYKKSGGSKTSSYTSIRNPVSKKEIELAQRALTWKAGGLPLFVHPLSPSHVSAADCRVSLVVKCDI